MSSMSVDKIALERERALRKRLEVQLMMKSMHIARLQYRISVLEDLIKRLSKYIPPEQRYMKVRCPECKTNYVTQILGPRGGLRKISPCPRCVEELDRLVRQKFWGEQ